MYQFYFSLHKVPCSLREKRTHVGFRVGGYHITSTQVVVGIGLTLADFAHETGMAVESKSKVTCAVAVSQRDGAMALEGSTYEKWWLWRRVKREGSPREVVVRVCFIWKKFAPECAPSRD